MPQKRVEATRAQTKGWGIASRWKPHKRVEATRVQDKRFGYRFAMGALGSRFALGCGPPPNLDSDTGLASRWIHGGCLGLRVRIVTGMASRFGHGSRFAMGSRRVSWIAGAHCHRNGFLVGDLGATFPEGSDR